MELGPIHSDRVEPVSQTVDPIRRNSERNQRLPRPLPAVPRGPSTISTSETRERRRSARSTTGVSGRPQDSPGRRHRHGRVATAPDN
jgi:hypothetical protein